MHSVFSRLLRKFPESAHTLRRTQTLTSVGLFLAIQMVLSSYGMIQVNDSLKNLAGAFGTCPNSDAVWPRRGGHSGRNE